MIFIIEEVINLSPTKERAQIAESITAEPLRVKAYAFIRTPRRKTTVLLHEAEDDCQIKAKHGDPADEHLKQNSSEGRNFHADPGDDLHPSMVTNSATLAP
jgi:hypothetical protein